MASAGVGHSAVLASNTDMRPPKLVAAILSVLVRSTYIGG